MSSRQHVARFDFDELLESWVWASSRPAGPAGDLPLRLGGGVQVEFDAADPARVVRVDIEAAPLDSELRPVGEAIAASSRDAATRALFGDGAWGFSAPGSSVEIEIKQYYRNMKYDLAKEPRAMEYALEAVRRTGLEPVRGSIRGGTDGATLTAKGLPTPNIFTGEQDFHGYGEWICVKDMELATETLCHLVAIWCEREA